VFYTFGDDQPRGLVVRAPEKTCGGIGKNKRTFGDMHNTHINIKPLPFNQAIQKPAGNN